MIYNLVFNLISKFIVRFVFIITNHHIKNQIVNHMNLFVGEMILFEGVSHLSCLVDELSIRHQGGIATPLVPLRQLVYQLSWNTQPLMNS